MYRGTQIYVYMAIAVLGITFIIVYVLAKKKNSTVTETVSYQQRPVFAVTPPAPPAIFVQAPQPTYYAQPQMAGLPAYSPSSPGPSSPSYVY